MSGPAQDEDDECIPFKETPSGNLMVDRRNVIFESKTLGIVAVNPKITTIEVRKAEADEIITNQEGDPYGVRHETNEDPKQTKSTESAQGHIVDHGERCGSSHHTDSKLNVNNANQEGSHGFCSQKRKKDRSVSDINSDQRDICGVCHDEVMFTQTSHDGASDVEGASQEDSCGFCAQMINTSTHSARRSGPSDSNLMRRAVLNSANMAGQGKETMDGGNEGFSPTDKQAGGRNPGLTSHDESADISRTDNAESIEGYTPGANQRTRIAPSQSTKTIESNNNLHTNSVTRVERERKGGNKSKYVESKQVEDGNVSGDNQGEKIVGLNQDKSKSVLDKSDLIAVQEKQGVKSSQAQSTVVHDNPRQSGKSDVLRGVVCGLRHDEPSPTIRADDLEQETLAMDLHSRQEDEAHEDNREQTGGDEVGGESRGCGRHQDSPSGSTADNETELNKQRTQHSGGLNRHRTKAGAADHKEDSCGSNCKQQAQLKKSRTVQNVVGGVVKRSSNSQQFSHARETRKMESGSSRELGGRGREADRCRGRSPSHQARIDIARHSEWSQQKQMALGLVKRLRGGANDCRVVKAGPYGEVGASQCSLASTVGSSLASSADQLPRPPTPLRWRECGSVELPPKTEVARLAERMLACSTAPDCVVRVYPEQFHCYKLVLACYSEYFASLGERGASEFELPVCKVPPPVFRLVYRWMLAGGHEARDMLTRQNVLPLLEAAQFLGVPRLEDQCWALLLNEEVFTENSALQLSLQAHRLNNQQVLELMEPRIATCFLPLVSTGDWEHLPAAIVRRLLASGYIAVHCEMEVFMSAVKWLLHNLRGRRKHVVDLMSCVRFGLIAPWQLVDIRHNAGAPEFAAIVAFPEVQRMLELGLSYGVNRCRYGYNSPEYIEVSNRLGLAEPEARNWVGENRNYRSYREFLETLEGYRVAMLHRRSREQVVSIPTSSTSGCIVQFPESQCDGMCLTASPVASPSKPALLPPPTAKSTGVHCHLNPHDKATWTGSAPEYSHSQNKAPSIVHQVTPDVTTSQFSYPVNKATLITPKNATVSQFSHPQGKTTLIAPPMSKNPIVSQISHPKDKATLITPNNAAVSQFSRLQGKDTLVAPTMSPNDNVSPLSHPQDKATLITPNNATVSQFINHHVKGNLISEEKPRNTNISQSSYYKNKATLIAS